MHHPPTHDGTYRSLRDLSMDQFRGLVMSPEERRHQEVMKALAAISQGLKDLIPHGTPPAREALVETIINAIYHRERLATLRYAPTKVFPGSRR